MTVYVTHVGYKTAKPFATHKEALQHSTDGNVYESVVSNAEEANMLISSWGLRCRKDNCTGFHHV